MQSDINAPLEQLDALEKHISGWINQHRYIPAAYALAKIRFLRLYLNPYESFDDYLQDRWDIQRRRAEQLLKSLDTVLELAQCEQVCVSTQIDSYEQLFASIEIYTCEQLFASGKIDDGDQLIAYIMDNQARYPSREAYTRPLNRLKTVAERYAAWQAVLKTGNISIKHIQAQVGKPEHTGKPSNAQAFAAKYQPRPYTPPKFNKKGGGNYTPKHNIAAQHGLIPLLGGSAYVLLDVLLMKSMGRATFAIENSELQTLTGYTPKTLKTARETLETHCVIKVLRDHEHATKSKTVYTLHDIEWVLQANGLIQADPEQTPAEEPKEEKPAIQQPHVAHDASADTPEEDANNCSQQDEDTLYIIAAILCGLASPVTGISPKDFWASQIKNRKQLQAELSRKNSGLREQAIERIDLYEQSKAKPQTKEQTIQLTPVPNAEEKIDHIATLCGFDQGSKETTKMGKDAKGKTIIVVINQYLSAKLKKHKKAISEYIGEDITNQQILHNLEKEQLVIA